MRKGLAVGLAIVVVVIGGTSLWQTLRVREPAYQGRSLSEWLNDYDRLLLVPALSEAQRSLRNDSEHAIYCIGTNAIPFLLARLQVSEASVVSRLAVILKRIPFHMGHFYTAPEYHRVAIAGFQALGPKGEAAVPELAKMLDVPGLRKWAAMQVLIRFHDEAAIPVLMRAAANSNPQIRERALLDLGDRRQSTPEMIKVVIGRLRNDPDQGVRSMAALALGHFPKTESGLIVPALMQALRDPAMPVQSSAAQSLGDFGNEAKEAVSALQEIVKVHGPRCTAAGALYRIDPAAAASVGIKRRPDFLEFE